MIKNIWGISAIFILLLISVIFVTSYFINVGENTLLISDPRTMISMLSLDIALIFTLTVIVSYKIVKLWLHRKRNFVGSNLQIKMVLMFAVVSAIPTIIISIFSTLFFYYGIQSWFNDKVSIALNGSLSVAKAYLHEHNSSIISNAQDIADSISSNAYLFYNWPKLLVQLIDEQVAVRNLTEIIVFRSNNIIAKSSLSFTFSLDSIPSVHIDKAKETGISVFINKNNDKVMAVVKLHNFIDTYLLLTKLVDSQILQTISDTQGAVHSYTNLHNKISSLQIQFSIMFAAVSLLLILAAIWAGISFAGDIVNPLIDLIIATKKVTDGDLRSKVKENSKGEEVNTLAIAFNQMTAQIERQHTALIIANKNLDERREFIEAVISSLSSGIIVIDKNYKITLSNCAANTILHKKDLTNIDALLKDIPEIIQLLTKCIDNQMEILQEQLYFKLDNQHITLLIKIVSVGNKKDRFIIALDDISDLVAAQKIFAWSDITKRIAHEIKNPITPIHLAAERLKIKYTNKLTEGQDTFIKYTDTIMRHVKNISNIIDEFTNFARMPSPKLELHDIGKLLENVIFSSQLINVNIKYNLVIKSEEPVMTMIDPEQMTQVFLNIFKNSCEAIGDTVGKISIILYKSNTYISIIITDTGGGLPNNIINNLTEPYITTKKQGTGLGLSIVKKIIMEHNGTLKISNEKEGAEVNIRLPIYKTMDPLQ